LSLESTSKDAGIVINCAPDITHDASIAAILRGLKSRSERGFYMHTSGAALIWDEPDGKSSAKIWDDVADIEALTSMPDDTTHRITDKMVLAAASDINVAIVSPVAVYGLSPSIEHPLPLTLPHLLNAITYVSAGFTVSEGRNMIAYVHALDLARIYLLLLHHALHPSPNTSVWGSQAYYFGASHELSFTDFMVAVVRALGKKGVLASEEIKQIDLIQVARGIGVSEREEMLAPDSWAMHIAVMFGCNMRVCASRARALGWEPREQSVEDTLEVVLGKYLEMSK